MKPPSLAIILAKKIAKGKGSAEGSDAEEAGESPAEESSEDRDTMGLEAAFDDVAAAIKSGDSKAGADALKSFIDQC